MDPLQKSRNGHALKTEKVGVRYLCRRDDPVLIDNRVSVLQITNTTANMPGEDNNNIPSANIITDVVPVFSPPQMHMVNRHPLYRTQVQSPLPQLSRPTP